MFNPIRPLMFILLINTILVDMGMLNSINTVNTKYIKNTIKERNLTGININEVEGYASFFFEKSKNFTDFSILKLPISLKENFANKLNDFIPKNKIETINITYTHRNMKKSLWEIGLLLFAIYFLSSLFKKSLIGGLGMSVAEQRSGEFTVVQNETTTLKDVIGLEPVKDDLIQIIDMIKNRENYINYGCEVPRGIIFTGPPGCGKSLLAKAVAGEANVNFISASGSDFMEVYVGVGSSRVRKLFSLARSLSPCIIFIDEIDSIGKSRDKKFVSNSEQDNTLNSLLHEMDGFKKNENIIVIAATNLYKTLDPALVRSGRFDKKIVFDLPNIKEREALFQMYMNKIKLDKDVTVNFNKYIALLAGRTAGMSGADIKNITRQAILNFMKRNIEKIKTVLPSMKIEDAEGANLKDFEIGVDDIALGMAKRERLTTERERDIVAHHEAGHAVLAYVLKECQSPVKVTTIPRGEDSLGVTQSEPSDKKIQTKEELLARMSMAYGGKLAEDLVFGLTTTGASSDISTITKIAYAMVSLYGMSDSIGDIDTMSESNPYKDFISEGLKSKIDEEAKNIKQSIKKASIKLMQKYEKHMKMIASLLLEKEEINKEDLKELFKDDPIENSESIKNYLL